MAIRAGMATPRASVGSFAKSTTYLTGRADVQRLDEDVAPNELLFPVGHLTSDDDANLPAPELLFPVGSIGDDDHDEPPTPGILYPVGSITSTSDEGSPAASPTQVSRRSGRGASVSSPSAGLASRSAVGACA
jgi:hypothetical protein